MAANSPVFELLQRNEDEFVGRDLIIAGDILDPMVFSLVKRSHSATVIVDNFVVCKKMAAMIGKSMDDSCPQIIVCIKHLTFKFETSVLKFSKAIIKVLINHSCK